MAVNENLPIPGRFVDQPLKDLFNTEMRQLLVDVGLPLKLHMSPLQNPCPNCLWDNVNKRSSGIYQTGGPKSFTRGQVCPWCKGKGIILEKRQENFTAIMDPSKETIEDRAQELGFRATENLMRTITVIETFDSIKQALSATIQNEQYRIHAGPVKIGLGAEQFVDTFWKKEPK